MRSNAMRGLGNERSGSYAAAPGLGMALGLNCGARAIRGIRLMLTPSQLSQARALLTRVVSMKEAIGVFNSQVPLVIAPSDETLENLYEIFRDKGQEAA